MKAPLFLSLAPAAAACRQVAPVAPAEVQRACLKRICYLLFPYPELGDEPYERAAAALAASAAGRADLQAMVAEGVARLDGDGARPFIALDEAQQVEKLKEIETGPFFRWLYQAAIDHLYDDQRVWTLIGYEGSSFEKGGYLQRGFADIDWL